ncbi:hypothetical protein F0562_022733 [Nyssa sinensis]|uniref:Uncharacterized protein n=1 Tax=Nyssa sinensis TaxID=561372 RepID=A0A5J5BK85_9ASTE|nr:hypothetical protein F0562_022733 [Nyssa sinensis]
MAVRSRCTPPTIVIQKSGPIRKPVSRVLMLAHSQISLKKTAILQIRSSIRNKVYEDESKGIVCYRDENGEITCEGYDEGPRLQQQFERKNYNSSDAENTNDILPKSWLQIVGGGEISHADKSVAGQKDFNFNGFNTFY